GAGTRDTKRGGGPRGRARLEPGGRDEVGYLRPRPLDPVRARVPARDLVPEGEEIPGMAHADRAGADHEETHQRSLSARRARATRWAPRPSTRRRARVPSDSRRPASPATRFS